MIDAIDSYVIVHNSASFVAWPLTSPLLLADEANTEILCASSTDALANTMSAVILSCNLVVSDMELNFATLAAKRCSKFLNPTFASLLVSNRRLKSLNV